MNKFTKLLYEPIGLDVLSEISGIYCIVCSEKQKLYIGLSDNPLSRVQQHAKQLLSGSHSNKELSRDVANLGLCKFKFIYIIGCEKEDLVDYENKAIAYFSYIGKESYLYNCVRKINGERIAGIHEAYDYIQKTISDNTSDELVERMDELYQRIIGIWAAQ